MKRLFTKVTVVLAVLGLLVAGCCTMAFAWDKDCAKGNACRISPQAKAKVCKECCDTDLAFEQGIKARFLQGFEEWNKGHEAWLEWCKTLYEPDALYTIYGKQYTLAEYQAMMAQFRRAYDLKLGTIHNIIIQGDWGSIFYDATITELATGQSHDITTMEFVHFKKNPAPIGVRVIHGWALSSNPVE